MENRSKCFILDDNKAYTSTEIADLYLGHCSKVRIKFMLQNPLTTASKIENDYDLRDKISTGTDHCHIVLEDGSNISFCLYSKNYEKITIGGKVEPKMFGAYIYTKDGRLSFYGNLEDFVQKFKNKTFLTASKEEQIKTYYEYEIKTKDKYGKLDEEDKDKDINNIFKKLANKEFNLENREYSGTEIMKKYINFCNMTRSRYKKIKLKSAKEIIDSNLNDYILELDCDLKIKISLKTDVYDDFFKQECDLDNVKVEILEADGSVFRELSGNQFYWWQRADFKVNRVHHKEMHYDYNSPLWKNSFADKYNFSKNDDKISVRELLSLYMDNLTKAKSDYYDIQADSSISNEELAQKKEELMEKVAEKRVVLDNNTVLEFLAGNQPLDRIVSNITINIYDENMHLLDSLKAEEQNNIRYDNLMNYLTGISSADPLIEKTKEIDNPDEEIKRRLEEEQAKLEKVQALKKEYEDAISDTVTSIYSDQRVPIVSEILFEENSNHSKVIKEKYRDNKILSKLDLSFIDFTNVDVRGVDFRGCNPSFLNPQTVYRKDLSNTNFSVDEYHLVEYAFNMYTDFRDVNLKGANLYAPGSILLDFDGAITDEHTVLPSMYQQEMKTNRIKKHNNKF